MLTKALLTIAFFAVVAIAMVVARLFDDIQKEEGRKHRW